MLGVSAALLYIGRKYLPSDDEFEEDENNEMMLEREMREQRERQMRMGGMGMGASTDYRMMEGQGGGQNFAQQAVVLG